MVTAALRNQFRCTKPVRCKTLGYRLLVGLGLCLAESTGLPHLHTSSHIRRLSRLAYHVVT
jgi:hypothetical protein